MTDLILTDRSRIVEGFKCPMKRFYRYHSMESGYGVVRKAHSMPLATGTFVHQALEQILILQKESAAIIPEPLVDAAITTAVRNYQLMIKGRGYLDIEEGREQTEYILAEQTALVSGLVWAWYYYMLPELIRQYQIIEIEEEHTYQIPGSKVAIMARPDFVCRDRTSGKLSIHDFKTASYAPTPADWSDSPQMALGTLAVEDALGEPVESYCMHALIKGQRKATYNQETREYDGPKQQHSIYCYGQWRPGSPPLSEEDWKPHHEFIEDGKKRKTGKAYQRTPVWEHWDAKEWVRFVGEDPYNRSHIYKSLMVLGPYERQSEVLASLVESIRLTEEKWLQDRWAAYDLARRYQWDSSDYQDKLTKIIPRSFNCRDYKRDCEYKQLCYHHYGWKELGEFTPRRPHHQQEIDEMVARGIEVPPEAWEEEE